jgi:membrane-associated protein
MIDTLSNYFLTWVIAYGAPVFAAILLLGGFGLPMPSSIMLIAAGAFIRQGMVDATSVIWMGFLATIAGDSLSYGMGKLIGGRLPARMKNSKTWNSAQGVFDRRGGLAIFLTRSVLSSLAIPTNLIAGSSDYRFKSFLIFDVAGEVLWFGAYGGLGYAFGSQWELISQFLADFGGLIAGLAVLAIGGYYAIRWLNSGQQKLAPAVDEIIMVETNLTESPIKK